MNWDECNIKGNPHMVWCVIIPFLSMLYSLQYLVVACGCVCVCGVGIYDIVVVR